MKQTIIRLALTKVIDISATSNFEKNVFNDSYTEFLMQAQAYNRENKFRTLQEMIDNNPKANSLHYKVGFSIGKYIQNLNNQIHGWNTQGLVLGFESHEFRIVESDITDKSKHKVSLTYITDYLNLTDDFGEYLVLSKNKTADTFTIKLQPHISVVSYEKSLSPVLA